MNPMCIANRELRIKKTIEETKKWYEMYLGESNDACFSFFQKKRKKKEVGVERKGDRERERGQGYKKEKMYIVYVRK